jgi:D-amino-acid dehydrogenase
LIRLRAAALRQTRLRNALVSEYKNGMRHRSKGGLRFANPRCGSANRKASHPMTTPASRHVAIIGAGAVGVICAIEALRDGHRVTLIDAGEPGGDQAASYGNAGWLSPHSVVPPALPGDWRKIPKYLSDPLGPLAIRWSYLPRLLPWFVRYLQSGWTEARLDATARALRTLLQDAPLLHKRLAEEAGAGELIERRGLLHIFPSRAPFDADLGWRIRGRVGVTWLELSADELRQREPALDPRYTFGVLVEDGGHCRDPGGYVAALARHAVANGATIVKGRTGGLKLAGGRLAAVLTDTGAIACDAAVIAAGIRSKGLAASIGDRLPLESERGYHVMVEAAESGPRTPVMASDTKMAVTWMAGGLRAAGQVEFAGLGAPPDWRRAGILRRNLAGMFPGLPATIRDERIKTWVGHRPSMPDGRPCIGHARASRDVIYAFGHGHTGLAGSARTGRLVAQLLGDREPEIPLAPFAPARFL